MKKIFSFLVCFTLLFFLVSVDAYASPGYIDDYLPVDDDRGIGDICDMLFSIDDSLKVLCEVVSRDIASDLKSYPRGSMKTDITTLKSTLTSIKTNTTTTNTNLKNINYDSSDIYDLLDGFYTDYENLVKMMKTGK